MPTLLVFHEVDDVDHWLASPKREEFFGPLGMTARTFRDPAGSNRVGLIHHESESRQRRSMRATAPSHAKQDDRFGRRVE